MADDHPLTLTDLKLSQNEGDEAHRLQKAFIERVRKDRIAAEFSSPADLETKANKSFFALQSNFEEVNTLAPVHEPPPNPDDNLPIAAPVFHYVRKPYVERQGFAGRTKELTLIDQWATGSDAMLLFQAIGGMGKSMLTWHWVKNLAPKVRADWAGLLWYSFYEQGADLNDFCVHALAYIRHQPPKTFRGRRTLDLGVELLRELDAQPWLLILDGLERVLVAYNRAGKEHMTDEEAVVVRDGMGLDREPRDCFRPEDDDVLAMLAQTRRGKLLASSRLTPTALTNAARQPIPGVTRVTLEGLAPEDAEQVLRNAGARGDGWRMQRFLDDKFRCHPLSVGVVAGQLMTFLDARGDFDRWVESPKGGADPALIAKDLRGRQNHILSRAFEDLDDDKKALLGGIAMASIELTADILRIINPKRPLEPPRVGPPRERENDKFNDFEHWHLKRGRDRATTDEKWSEAEAKVDAYRKRLFAKQKERYDAYVIAHSAWQLKTVEADTWLHQSLPDLEARGLLQYDPDTGSLDMHPAIRHTVLLELSPETKGKTGSHVSDALSSRPFKPLNEARTREDLALAMTRVQSLNSAGKLADGWNLLESSGLSSALHRLEYFHELLEIAQAYFPNGLANNPYVVPKEELKNLFSIVADSLYKVDNRELAIKFYTRLIELCLQEEESLIGIPIFNLGVVLESEDESARAARLFHLAACLAEVTDDSNLSVSVKAHYVAEQIDNGHLLEAQTTMNSLRETVEITGLNSATESLVLRTDLDLAFRSHRLDELIAERCLKRICALGDRFDEIQCRWRIAFWRQAQGDHSKALDAFEDLIGLVHEIGRSPARYEARRGLSLAALGRREEAIRIAGKVEQAKRPQHISLALLYLALGDRAKARTHALTGYREAWGEGPPYHDHWGLEDCRKVLAAVDEPEPVLPPFDPAKVEPFDFEPDVERLIGKKLAEKAKRTEEKAKRDAVKPDS